MMDQPTNEIPGLTLHHTLRGHTDVITNIAWSPDGTMLASSAKDGTVRLWNAQTEKLQEVLEHDSKRIYNVAWSPDSQMLAAGAEDGNVWLWKARRGILERKIKTSPKMSGTYYVPGDVQRVVEDLSNAVCSVAWSPGGTTIATGHQGSWSNVRFWSVVDGMERQPEREDGMERQPERGGGDYAEGSIDKRVGHFINSGTVVGVNIGTVIYQQTRTGSRPRPFVELADQRPDASLEWSPTGTSLARASSRASIDLYDAETLRETQHLRNEYSKGFDVAWSPDGVMLALAWLDGTVQIWNPRDGSKLRVLEGHADAVTCVDFSHDGQFLASKSIDETVRIWRCSTWETVAVFEETVSGKWFSHLAFHPQLPKLATLGEQDTVIHLWQFDPDHLLNITPVSPTVHYTNAKVVLVGDSGVGKSGLGLVLSNHYFAPTDSTHGRHVWTFDQRPALIGGERVETHETLLWDLAGQPGYRIIHQLHLNEVAVAIIVFDSRSEIDPFAGVRHWDRALRLAQRLQGSAAPPLKKFLVAARADRGGIPVSDQRIKRVVQELGFEDFFETSAREGWGIEELKIAIRQAIDWSALPRVSSTSLFQQIKDFLVAEKETGRVLATVDDLYRTFLRTSQREETTELRAQFETCIGRIESRGLIRWLSFGGFILLQPEQLDAYASSLVNAAKDEPDGLGSIAEEDARIGRFRMSEDERINDKDQEQLLLIATVEELLRHEIALREQADDGAYLIFPSQFTREWPDAPDPQGQSLDFSFEGPVINVYATLAVRLSRSGIFTKQDKWKNAATYTTVTGGTYGMFLRERGEGSGEITLFYDRSVSKDMCQSFANYIRRHLHHRALPETIQERRFVICLQCGQTLPEQQVQHRLKVGKNQITCGYCDTVNPLTTLKDEISEVVQSNLPAMDYAANTGRDQDMLGTILQGKAAADDFDVFLCHHPTDRSAVEQIAEQLKKAGILPWLYDDRSWNELRARLRDTLADLYPKESSSYRIVDDAGVPRDRINFSATAIDNWHSILTEADKHNKIPTILEISHRDYPENTTLKWFRARMIPFAKAVVVCVGSSQRAFWEQPEVDVALRELVKDGQPVIPVLLPGAIQQPELPLFLQK